jgi:hypothetical protein
MYIYIYINQEKTKKEGRGMRGPKCICGRIGRVRVDVCMQKKTKRDPCRASKHTLSAKAPMQDLAIAESAKANPEGGSMCVCMNVYVCGVYGCV